MPRATSPIRSTATRRRFDSIDPLKLVLGVGYRDPRRPLRRPAHLTAHRAQGGRRAAHRLPVAPATARLNCYRPPASTVLDATAFWRIGENLTLRAGLFNITDEKLRLLGATCAGLAATSAVTDAYTQPGRNARVSLTFRF